MKLRTFVQETFRHDYTCPLCGREKFDETPFCKRCETLFAEPRLFVCPKCGRKTAIEGMCLDCKSNLPTFTRGFTPFIYRDQIAAMINRMKNSNPRPALYLGEQMAEYFAEKHFQKSQSQEELLIVPVPMTKTKIIERGYNQSLRLAESVCARLQSLGYTARVEDELLQKRKETAPQKQMTYYERLENVSGAYHVHKRKECRGKVIILIDDVMTTGATSSECAARLFGAGAKEVYFLVAAAVIERR